jgi:hypothetical protein
MLTPSKGELLHGRCRSCKPPEAITCRHSKYVSSAHHCHRRHCSAACSEAQCLLGCLVNENPCSALLPTVQAPGSPAEIKEQLASWAAGMPRCSGAAPSRADNNPTDKAASCTGKPCQVSDLTAVLGIRGLAHHGDCSCQPDQSRCLWQSCTAL